MQVEAIATGSFQWLKYGGATIGFCSGNFAQCIIFG